MAVAADCPLGGGGASDQRGGIGPLAPAYPPSAPAGAYPACAVMGEAAVAPIGFVATGDPATGEGPDGIASVGWLGVGKLDGPGAGGVAAMSPNPLVEGCVAGAKEPVAAVGTPP